MFSQWALRRVSRFVLRRVLGRALRSEAAALRQLEVQLSLGGGALELRGLPLSEAFLNDQLKSSNFVVTSGYIGLVRAKIPWKNITSQSCSVELHDVKIVLSPQHRTSENASSFVSQKPKGSSSSMEGEEAEGFGGMEGEGRSYGRVVGEGGRESVFGSGTERGSGGGGAAGYLGVEDGVRGIAKLVEKILLGLKVTVVNLVVQLEAESPSPSPATEDPLGMERECESEREREREKERESNRKPVMLILRIESLEYGGSGSSPVGESGNRGYENGSGLKGFLNGEGPRGEYMVAKTVTFNGVHLELVDGGSKTHMKHVHDAAMVGESVGEEEREDEFPNVEIPASRSSLLRSTDESIRGSLLINIPWREGRGMQMSKISMESTLSGISIHLYPQNIESLLLLLGAVKKGGGVQSLYNSREGVAFRKECLDSENLSNFEGTGSSFLVNKVKGGSQSWVGDWRRSERAVQKEAQGMMFGRKEGSPSLSAEREGETRSFVHIECGEEGASDSPRAFPVTHFMPNWMYWAGSDGEGEDEAAEGAEADLAASVDEFFDCLDSSLGSPSSVCGSGLWTWTCSALTALSAASSIAAGSALILPVSSFPAHISATARLASLSVYLFYDENLEKCGNLEIFEPISKERSGPKGPSEHSEGFSRCIEIFAEQAVISVSVSDHQTAIEASISVFELAEQLPLNEKSSSCSFNDWIKEANKSLPSPHIDSKSGREALSLEGLERRLYLSFSQAAPSSLNKLNSPLVIGGTQEASALRFTVTWGLNGGREERERERSLDIAAFLLPASLWLELESIHRMAKLVLKWKEEVQKCNNVKEKSSPVRPNLDEYGFNRGEEESRSDITKFRVRFRCPVLRIGFCCFPQRNGERMYGIEEPPLCKTEKMMFFVLDFTGYPLNSGRGNGWRDAANGEARQALLTFENTPRKGEKGGRGRGEGEGEGEGDSLSVCVTRAAAFLGEIYSATGQRFERKCFGFISLVARESNTGGEGEGRRGSGNGDLAVGSAAVVEVCFSEREGTGNSLMKEAWEATMAQRKRADGGSGVGGSHGMDFAAAAVGEAGVEDVYASDVREQILATSKVTVVGKFQRVNIESSESQIEVLLKMLKHVEEDFEIRKIVAQTSSSSERNRGRESGRKEERSRQFALQTSFDSVEVLLRLQAGEEVLGGERRGEREGEKVEENGEERGERRGEGVWEKPIWGQGWKHVRVIVENVALFYAEGVGGVVGGKYMWVQHRECNIYAARTDVKTVHRTQSSHGSSSPTPSASSSGYPSLGEEFKVFECKETAIGRGDGGVGEGNALAGGVVGAAITYVSWPGRGRGSESVIAVSVRGATLIAKGGRVDWMMALKNMFIENVEKYGRREGEEGEEGEERREGGEDKEKISRRKSSMYLLLDIYDSAVAYEPSSTGMEGQGGGSARSSLLPPVAGVVAAAALRVAGRLPLLSLWVRDTAGGLLPLGGCIEQDYSRSQLQKAGFVQVARCAVLGASVRTNEDTAPAWQILCSNFLLRLDTCRDSAAAAARLAGQLSQLLASDVVPTRPPGPRHVSNLGRVSANQTCRDGHVASPHWLEHSVVGGIAERNSRGVGRVESGNGVYLRNSNLGDSKSNGQTLLAGLEENAFSVQRVGGDNRGGKNSWEFSHPSSERVGRDGGDGQEGREGRVEGDGREVGDGSDERGGRDMRGVGEGREGAMVYSIESPSFGTVGLPLLIEDFFRNGCRNTAGSERGEGEGGEEGESRRSVEGEGNGEVKGDGKGEGKGEGKGGGNVEGKGEGGGRNLPLNGGQPQAAWYDGSGATLRENHIPEPMKGEVGGGRGGGGSGGVEESKSLLPRRYPPSVGRVHLKGVSVRWRLYGGTDWSPDLEGGAGESRNDSGRGRARSRERERGREGERPERESHRDTDVCVEVVLEGVEVQHDIFGEGVSYASRLAVGVREVGVYDCSRDATWQLIMGYHRSKGMPREAYSRAVRVLMDAVRPDPTAIFEEYRLTLALFPIRLHLDHRHVDFFTQFFSPPVSKSGKSSGSENSENSTSGNSPLGLLTALELEAAEEAEALLPFFQICEMRPLSVRVDYSPGRVDLSALRGGSLGQLANLVSWKEVDVELKGVRAQGVHGWGSFGGIVAGEWLEDISQRQLHKLLQGVGPVSPLCAVGVAVAELLTLPLEHYRRDRRLLRGMRRGAVAFVKTVSLEVLDIGAHLAGGAHEFLHLAETALGGLPGGSTALVAAVVVPGNPKLSQSPNYHQALQNPQNPKTPKNPKSPQNPKNSKEGFQQACESLSWGFQRSANGLVGEPVKAFQRGVGAGGVVGRALRGAPAALVAPASGAAGAVQRALLGVRNGLDPERKRESDEKHSGPPPECTRTLTFG